MDIHLQPIAFVRNSRKEIKDDYWGSVISQIELAPGVPEEALENIESFSHLEIIYFFDQTDKVVYAGRPRENPEWPVMGIFAQRKKDRPNHIGLATVQLLSHKGRILEVSGLDALDGTPIVDIKPVFREFSSHTETRQPSWVAELMENYWKF